MTGEMALGLGSAVWLGVLTSISPCPLATNIAAISFIGRRVGSPKAVATTGLLYTLGRSVTYIVLAVILVSSLLSAPAVSHVLQKQMNKALGPLLILVGMLQLELIQVGSLGIDARAGVGKRVEGWGVWGGLALGIAFALSFCPASAGLFFGSLLPLSIKCESRVLLPLVFGVGTALPVCVFAILISFGTRAVARTFAKITKFEWWARRVTGVIFLVVGVYFCLAFIFRVL